ncbi:CHASE domain-containing protein [Azohydromonas aeria]|uniref:CHASE domain-containing protein n=1 Tax=Azohydromonas aeria TaxID=2590212 RepID=UPI0012FB50F7|nr:CHASE domain-containing protein [Azohydromonas aeria]
MSALLPAFPVRSALREWVRSATWPWTVLGGALVLTLVATFMAQSAVEARRSAAVEAVIEADMGRLRSRLDAHVALLDATRAFVETQGPALDRARFHDYVSRLHIRRGYPSIQGIGYSPRVLPGRAAEFEAQARREGVSDFRITPAGERPWTFSIVYLEPLDERNRAALGFDMFSEPGRAQAMARARDSGSVAMTGRVTLRQEIEPRKKPGFLLYAPLYGPGPEPRTVQERQARLVGFVYVPFRAPDFFQDLFTAASRVVQARVYAAATPDPASLLHDGLSPADSAGSGLRRTLQFGGQPWTVEFVPVAPQHRLEAWLPQVTALVGGSVALLLFLLTRSQARGRRRTEAIARERSVALEGERAQRQLAESLSQIALALGSERDVSKLLQRLTDEATRLTGAAFGAYFHNEPDAGGRYGLYTLSGSDIETFRSFPPVRATPLFAQTFDGHTVRLDDVRTSPLYGRNPPHRGMPAGHPPVVSYLAACVRTREGRILGALLMGHPQPARFQPEHERLLEGLAAQAGVALENQQLLQSEREARAHAEEQRALLDLVIEQSGEGIIVADAQGALRIVNMAAQQQLGAMPPLAQPGGASRLDVFSLEHQHVPPQQAPLPRALAGEAVLQARWAVQRNDGSWRSLTGSATPLRRHDGASAGAVLVVRDETERIRAEQERESLLQALALSNKELDQFAYVTSHDLKAPLRGIANLAQWIQEDLGEQGEQIAQYTQLLQGRVHRMEALIDGILQYSRAGRVVAAPVEVDVAALLHEVVELLAPPPGVAIDVVAPLPVVTADRTALQQVLLNLVGNALKHAARDKGTVQVAARDDGQCWEFRVADNGPGIAPQYHDRIWAIFQTLEARDKVEGTGIGLSIVRKTVEFQGGRAWVESSEGNGATFFFTWPKQPPKGKT